MRSKEIRNALVELEASAATFRSLVRKVEGRVDPVADNIDLTVKTGRNTLKKIQGTLGLFDRLLRSNSPLQSGYIRLADELTETARSIKGLVDMLERNPEAFIFGKRRR